MRTPRDRILQRLARARAFAAGRRPEPHAAGRVPVAATVEQPVAPPPLRTQFETEFAALGGIVHHAVDGVAAARVVGELCRGHACNRVLTWSAEAIEVEGFAEGIAAGGLTLIGGDLPRGEEQRAALNALEPLRVGLTGADGAIAESGSLALLSGPGRPRLASLLPPVHVAILRADRIHASLPALIAALGDRVRDSSNLVIITGPSRTADIEMTLTRGVHGPGEIHAIIVEPGRGRG